MTRLGQLLSVAMAATLTGCAATRNKDVFSEPYGWLGAEIRVIEVSSQPALQRTVVGSYAQHEQVIRELCNVARGSGLDTERATYVGVYPDDPRSIPENELRWTIAMPMDTESIDITPPYVVVQLPACTAMVYEATATTLGQRSHECDAVIAQRWLEQSGATRLVILGKDEHGVDLFRVLKPVRPRND